MDDDVVNDGPIPWRPAGRLAPQRNSPGEWHEIPADGYPHAHHHSCLCEPDLQAATTSEGVKTLWVHKPRDHP